MVDATTSILTGEASPDFWIKMLAVYDYRIHLNVPFTV